MGVRDGKETESVELGIADRDRACGGDRADFRVAEEPLKPPHVAKKKTATRGKKDAQKNSHTWQPEKVTNINERLAKRQKTQQPETATRGGKLVAKKTKKGIGPWRVDAVKASAGTWAFRLRRYVDGKRTTPIYVSRVTDAVYEMIRAENYEQTKEQLISNHVQGAVRASYGT